MVTSTQTVKNISSALAWLLAAACLTYLIFIHHLFASHPLLIAVQVGAVILMALARKTFGLRSFHATAKTSQGSLVTHGPFRYWRHPIYAAIIYFVWAGQIQSPTVGSLLGAGGVTLFLFIRMVIEEQFLREAYPEYEAYAKRAKRLIPYVF